MNLKEYNSEMKKIESYKFNDYNKGAIAMLKLISEDMGWEDSEVRYAKLFFKD